MMWKYYPYLDNPYKNNINEQTKRRTFLQQIDSFLNQKQWVKITLLDWQENALKEIQGELTSGSITKDGASPIRRVCNFSCSVSGKEYDVENMNMDFAINKKIFIEIGIKNYTDEYPEFEFLWFPQGVFYISSVNIQTSATTSVNLSLQLKDKMAALNGEIGGVFNSTAILDSVDTQLPTGEYTTEKVKIYDLIIELVNHFGGETLTNIVVEDVPPRIQRVMRWMGSNPIWIKDLNNDPDGKNFTIKTEEPTDTSGWKVFYKGDDVGYVYDDLFYTDELIAAPGETVTGILDKLVQYLGNYEYFYDEFGVFHFREIKNYLNTTQASIVQFEANVGYINAEKPSIQSFADGKSDNIDAYLVDVTTGKSIYNFSDDQNLISLNVNPQYNNIKNDFVVQGLKQTTNESVSYPIMYHLAIDYKPKAGNTYRDLLLYKSPTDGLTKAMFPKHIPPGDKLPEVGNFNLFYMLSQDYTENGTEYKAYKQKGDVVYFWSEDNVYVPIEPIIYYSNATNASGEYISEGYITKDWRTEIYLRGLLARVNGTDASQYFTNLVDKNNGNDVSTPWLNDLYSTSQHDKVDIDFYYTELNAFWPEIYDLVEQKFYAEKEDASIQHTALTQGNYYLDFIDPDESGLGEFAVSNIGRRTIVSYNEQINCLFEPVFPDIVFINKDAEGAAELRNECNRIGKAYTQVSNDVFYALSTGGYHFSCFDEIKYQLFLHTNYAKTISIIALPAFYLEPNSRITINDASANCYGDYMLTNITIPFGAGSTMSVAASECNMDRLQ